MCFHTVQITKEVVDSYNFETGWGIPSCQLIALWTAQSRPSQLIHTVTLKGTKKLSYFSIVLDSDSISLASRGVLPMYQSRWNSILTGTHTQAVSITLINYERLCLKLGDVMLTALPSTRM